MCWKMCGNPVVEKSVLRIVSSDELDRSVVQIGPVGLIAPPNKGWQWLQ